MSSTYDYNVKRYDDMVAFDEANAERIYTELVTALTVQNDLQSKLKELQTLFQNLRSIEKHIRTKYTEGIQSDSQHVYEQADINLQNIMNVRGNFLMDIRTVETQIRTNQYAVKNLYYAVANSRAQVEETKQNKLNFYMACGVTAC